MRDTKLVPIKKMKVGDKFHNLTHPGGSRMASFEIIEICGAYCKIKVYDREETYSTEGLFAEVPLSDEEFKAKYKDGAAIIIEKLRNEISLTSANIGMHEMWNSWICTDPYEFAAEYEEHDIELIGWFELGNDAGELLKMDTSDLAKRMKDYEMRDRYFLQKRIPVAIRVDMRAGHTFTRGFKRPFDDIFMKSMQETAKYMCENMGNAKFAYVQSDEITIILVDYDTLETDCWFNYRTDKLCSIAASMATMAFNKIFSELVDEYNRSPESSGVQANWYLAALDRGAMFDARCFNIPKGEVTNLIYWRQLDATRNSIQMVGQANFSHAELQGKNCNEIQDMLHELRGINWNDYPAYLKRGTCIIKKEITSIEDGITTRSKWVIDDNIPIFKGEDRDYIEKLIYCQEKQDRSYSVS